MPFDTMTAEQRLETVIGILKPRLTETGSEPVGKVLLGTVKADLDDIGKNLWE